MAPSSPSRLSSHSHCCAPPLHLTHYYYSLLLCIYCILLLLVITSLSSSFPSRLPFHSRLTLPSPSHHHPLHTGARPKNSVKSNTRSHSDGNHGQTSIIRLPTSRQLGSGDPRGQVAARLERVDRGPVRFFLSFITVRPVHRTWALMRFANRFYSRIKSREDRLSCLSQGAERHHKIDGSACRSAESRT